MSFPLTDWICLNYKLVVVNVTSPFLLNSFSRLYHSFFTGKRIKTNPISLDFPRDFRLVFIISYGHTSATLLIASQQDVKTVSTRLGHAQTSTTMNIYAHALKESDRKAADALETMLGKRSSTHKKAQ